ncbi:MAG: amidohydrolase [Desulfobacteraceae bacterium]|nr:MAG: amidohydrolase [Desulfobacteraceae bacterium]
MPDLTVTLIQSDLAWENSAANLARWDAWIERSDRPTDLIVLPEMFSTGFSMNARALAQPMDGAAVTWLRNKAAARGVDMTGSLIIEENGLYYNRLIWARPDGGMLTYDKKHLFRYAGEEKIYTAGQGRLTLELNGWRIRPFICYDLRFPIWTRNLDRAYDLALFVANWPARRSVHWQVLLRARAIENQAFVIGVNRVGTDGRDLYHDGCSAVIAPAGEVLFEAKDREVLHTISLSRQALEDYRQQFPAWMDADKRCDRSVRRSPKDPPAELP